MHDVTENDSNSNATSTPPTNQSEWYMKNHAQLALSPNLERQISSVAEPCNLEKVRTKLRPNESQHLFSIGCNGLHRLGHANRKQVMIWNAYSHNLPPRERATSGVKTVLYGIYLDRRSPAFALLQSACCNSILLKP